MTKKVRLTKIAKDEMKETRAGEAGWWQRNCVCDCTCNGYNDGLSIGNGRYSAAYGGGGIGPINVDLNNSTR